MYLRNAPNTEPAAIKANSNPFIYFYELIDIISALDTNLSLILPPVLTQRQMLSIRIKNLDKFSKKLLPVVEKTVRIFNQITMLMIFIGLTFLSYWMTLKLRCEDYGFECDYILDEEKTISVIEKLRDHFEIEHGIDYTMEAVTQMITNRGHSLESIKK